MCNGLKIFSVLDAQLWLSNNWRSWTHCNSLYTVAINSAFTNTYFCGYNLIATSVCQFQWRALERFEKERKWGRSLEWSGKQKRRTCLTSYIEVQSSRWLVNESFFTNPQHLQANLYLYIQMYFNYLYCLSIFLLINTYWVIGYSLFWNVYLLLRADY
jgi:hypothetical protein